MKTAFIIIGILISFSCTSTSIGEKDLYGVYSYLSGDTLYEEFELNADRTFSSWLHQRPGSSGTWFFEKDTVYIMEEGFDTKVKLEIIELETDAAEFKFNDSSQSAKFKRIRE